MSPQTLFKSLGEMLYSSVSISDINAMISLQGGRYKTITSMFIELDLYSLTWTNSVVSEDTSFTSDK